MGRCGPSCGRSSPMAACSSAWSTSNAMSERTPWNDRFRAHSATRSSRGAISSPYTCVLTIDWAIAPFLGLLMVALTGWTRERTKMRMGRPARVSKFGNWNQFIFKKTTNYNKTENSSFPNFSIIPILHDAAEFVKIWCCSCTEGRVRYN